MSAKAVIPRPSLRRLPIYYRCLQGAIEAGSQYVSSDELGRPAGVPGAQVRKDLTYVAEFGRAGVGYPVRRLAALLEDYLGLLNDKEAVLVGAGSLGRALALYPGFRSYGLQIIALFDCDAAKIGELEDGRQIFPVDRLTDLVRRLQVRIGIITVPGCAAQAVADAMVAGGIRVIWNFAPCRLQVPEHVLVKNEDLAAELATLSHYVSQQSTLVEEG